MPLSKQTYAEYVELLTGTEVRLKLSPNPTTMGPGYIAEKIAEILDAKAIVNDMAEKVEIAYCDAQVALSDLEEEIKLRTDLAYESLQDDELDGKDAKAKAAYISTKVEREYVQTRIDILQPGDPHPLVYQLSEDLRIAKKSVIEFKSLLTILNHRRDQLNKLDSGVRLQQKTMETESRLYGESGKPKVDDRPALEIGANDAPDGAPDDTDLDEDPSPIVD